MKEITITNNKIQLIKAKALTFILTILIIILFANNIKTSSKMLKSDYLTYTTEELVEVKVAEQNNKFIEIKTTLDSKENIYYAEYTLDEFNKDVEIGNILSIGYVKGNNNMIYQLKNNDNTLIDLTDSLKTTGKSTLIFSIVCTALAFAFFLWKFLEIMLKPAVEKYDYVEYALSQENLITNKMIDKHSKTRKKVLIYNIACAVFIGILIITLLMFNSLLALLKDKKTMGYIIYASIMIPYLVLLFIFVPKFNTNKHNEATQYANDYISYIKNGPTFPSYYTPYEFKDLNTDENNHDEKNIVLVYSRKEVERSYVAGEVNLYAIGVYRKSFYGGNIFVATDRTDLSEKEVDFIFPLTFENYKQITDLNINVKGLDYLLENFDKEIIQAKETKTNKNIIVKYNK